MLRILSSTSWHGCEAFSVGCMLCLKGLREIVDVDHYSDQLNRKVASQIISIWKLGNRKLFDN